MLATFQALAVFVTTLLPGALFTLAFERESNGSVKADTNERILAFASVSAIFAILSAPLLYQGYRVYIVNGALKEGNPLPGWIWLVLAAYVLFPLGLGGWLGHKIKNRADEEEGKGATLIRIIGGPLNGSTGSPRAWERLFFTPNLSGYVKVKLKDVPPGENPWILGIWGAADPPVTPPANPPNNAPTAPPRPKRPGSYASGYPYDQDIYFYDTCEIEPDGAIRALSANPIVPIKTGVACLIRWDEIAYAEFIEVL
ncbi:hypothetical protein DBV08_18430 [Rhodococcus sp. KBW08]|uniref:DUF6338 family protein n=1 Tax=Rhodococcus sp. KBW08 TaxID=2144188 RepID=UPI000F5A0484|nr:DUF6338 family protein [Rhodococcus sp. KBW08]RQO45848.1 hypothetical protein DBV08_18430 [Rhodococcus sp. KBW08]